MEKSNKASIRSVPFALIVWLVGLVLFSLISALICTAAESPMKYTSLAAKFCVILSALFAGMSVRFLQGGFTHALICSAVICGILLVLTLTGEVKTENVICAIMNIPAGVLGYLLPAVFGKGKRPSRRRRQKRR